MRVTDQMVERATNVIFESLDTSSGSRVSREEFVRRALEAALMDAGGSTYDPHFRRLTVTKTLVFRVMVYDSPSGEPLFSMEDREMAPGDSLVAQYPPDGFKFEMSA